MIEQRPQQPDTSHDDELLGAFSVSEFASRYRICRSLIYGEVRAGRLRLTKVRSRSLITRTEAKRYQALLDAEAAAKQPAA